MTAWLLCTASILSPTVCWWVPQGVECHLYLQDWIQRMDAWEARNNLPISGGGNCYDLKQVTTGMLEQIVTAGDRR